jgi:hypothetical protein
LAKTGAKAGDTFHGRYREGKDLASKYIDVAVKLVKVTA